MKVLAINGSPRTRNSNTDRILQPFLAGAAAAGADCEVVYAAEMDVNDCRGCFACWNRTPGICVYHDDMPGLLEQIRGADYLVWAGPLYYYGMTARLQRIMERTLPLIKPYMIWNGERYVHPRRYEKEPKTVLISNCGFPDRINFRALQETFKLMLGDSPSASILCTGGELLGVDDLPGQFDWYLAAVHAAGRELISEGRIAEETERTLARSLVTADIFVPIANASWKVPGDEPPLPSDWSGKSTVKSLQGDCRLSQSDRDGSMHGLVTGMAMNFKPEAARNLAAVIQYEFTGREPGEYYLEIVNGSCIARSGQHPAPQLTIYSPSDVWRSISEGRLEGSTALMNGQYRFDGDLSLLMKLNQLFSGADPVPPVSQAKRSGGPLPIPGMGWLTVAFIPWVIFWVFSGWYGTAASVGALGLASIILLYRWVYWEISVMDAGSAVFFTVATGAGFITPAFMGHYGMVLGNLTLAALWAGTLMSEQPLTASYSKYKFAAEIQGTPLFIRINGILTAFWVVIYIVQAAIAIAAPPEPRLRAIWIAAINLLLIPAFIFTKRFPTWFISHRARDLR